ncbi:MAG: FliH/SctL family protein [Candidatus Gastranaerophilaceae bacterium]
MSRIESSTVQFGNSFVIGGTQSQMSESELKKNIQILSQQRENLLNEVKALDESLSTLKNDQNTIIEKANHQAEQILQKANEEANAKLENAENYINQVATQATEEGHKQGLEQGYIDGQQKFMTEMFEKISAVNALVEASFKAKREILVSGEREILELAVLMAEKVTKIKLDKDKKILSNIVKDAISCLKEREEIKILANPIFAEHLYSISEELKKEIKGINQIKIIEDKTISADGVIVESLESRADARLSTQITEIAKKLFEEHEDRPILTEFPEADCEQRVDGDGDPAVDRNSFNASNQAEIEDISKTERHSELATSSLVKPYEDEVPLDISESQDCEILNAEDGTLPCNSRFARKQGELQVQDDVSKENDITPSVKKPRSKKKDV